MYSHELKKAGLRTTLPRLKILQLFEESGKYQKNRHMSAEDIYHLLNDSGDAVSLATIYRVLTQFESAGLLIKHRFENEQSHYELNKGKHHDHLVCIKCQYVEEFFDDTIEKRQQAIALAKNFDMTDHNLIIYGICPSCQHAAAN